MLRGNDRRGEGLPDGLLAGPAENGLGLGVPFRNHPFGIRCDDCVKRILDDRAGPLLALTQRLLSLYRFQRPLDNARQEIKRLGRLHHAIQGPKLHGFNCHLLTPLGRDHYDGTTCFNNIGEQIEAVLARRGIEQDEVEAVIL